jgi:hypothetical protein
MKTTQTGGIRLLFASPGVAIAAMSLLNTASHRALGPTPMSDQSHDRLSDAHQRLDSGSVMIETSAATIGLSDAQDQTVTERYALASTAPRQRHSPPLAGVLDRQQRGHMQAAFTKAGARLDQLVDHVLGSGAALTPMRC